jgi:hypothetical protein
MGDVRKALGLSKNIAGANVGKHLPRLFDAMGQGTVHNLESMGELFSDAVLGTQRGDALRAYWLHKMVPREIVLRSESHRVFITNSKKRICVPTAREKEGGVYRFSAKPKSYEVFVLLCWDKELMLRDFVVPQKDYVRAWSLLKKTRKNEDITFSVYREGDRFTLHLEGAERVDISNYLSNYESLK